MTIGTTYHDSREPDEVRYGFICCPSCHSLYRADFAVITVQEYRTWAQMVRHNCPFCHWLVGDPEVYLIREQAIEALCRQATRLSKHAADEQQAKEVPSGRTD